MRHTSLSSAYVLAVLILPGKRDCKILMTGSLPTVAGYMLGHLLRVSSGKREQYLFKVSRNVSFGCPAERLLCSKTWCSCLPTLQLDTWVLVMLGLGVVQDRALKASRVPRCTQSTAMLALQHNLLSGRLHNSLTCICICGCLHINMLIIVWYIMRLPA